jgi:hypothetical protein
VPTPLLDNRQLGRDTARANLLTNGGFEVWQRGNSFGAASPGTAFYADRWQIQGAGTGTLALSRDTTNQDTGSGACCAATYTHVAGALLNLVQPLPAAEYPQLKGRVVSFSMRVRTSVANMVRVGVYDGSAWTYSPYHNGNGTYQTLTVSNVTLSAAATAWQMAAWWDNAISGLAYVDNAMLVVGSQYADYAPLHPADDLNRCLRYYEQINTFFNGNTWAGASGINYGYWWTYKAVKPVTPTITLPAFGSWSQLGISAVSADTASANGFRFVMTSNAIGNMQASISALVPGVVIEANP